MEKLRCGKVLKELYKKGDLTPKELNRVKLIKRKQEKLVNKAKHIISICDLIAIREMAHQPMGSSGW